MDGARVGVSSTVLPSRLRMMLTRLRMRYDERPADALSLQDAAAADTRADAVSARPPGRWRRQR